MKIIALALLLFSTSVYAQEKVRKDAEAKNQFLHLNFFAEGRGMHLVPGIIEVFEKSFEQNQWGLKVRDVLLHNHWGLNVENHWPVGLFDEKFKSMHVGALGCVACHSGKAAGQFIIGLGNKNIDVLRIGKDASLIQKLYKTMHPEEDSDDYKAVRDSALEFAQVLSNPKIGNTTQGMVPVSFIRHWFYKQAGVPMPADMRKGAVKIPALWGYGEKRKVGQFSDGYGDGNFPGWAVAVELTAGQSVSTVRAYQSKIETAEDLFSDFLPPRYPFGIDENKSTRGQKIFEKTCAGCHGTYERDSEGLPVYKSPKFIAWNKVQTDDDRLISNTPQFNQLVENNPLKDIIKHTSLGPGFFAPRLVGVWSRFPYLHNGSIPNIASLLADPKKRPKTFSLRNAGELRRFDQEGLGLKIDEDSDTEVIQDLDVMSLEDLRDWFMRSTYNTKDIGHSNQGHAFGLKLSPTEKTDLIEYLKTL